MEKKKVQTTMNKFLKRKLVSDQQPSVQDNAHDQLDSSSKTSQLNDKSNIPMGSGVEQPLIQNEDKTRLKVAIQAMVFCLRQGWAFRGNEAEDLEDFQESYLDLMRLKHSYREGLKKDVTQDDPEVVKLAEPDIQSDILNAAGMETISAICKDLGDSLFSVFIGQSHAAKWEPQMTVVLRYMDNSGFVIERFLGIFNITEFTAASLKTKLDAFFGKYGLSMSNLRGYGDSDMHSEFYGLKSLILTENKSAFYFHWFAHGLHTRLIYVSKNHLEIYELCKLISDATNIVGESFKHLDTLAQDQAAKVIEKLKCDELTTGERFNQENSLRRFGEANSLPDFRTLRDLILKFSSVLDLLELVAEGDLKLGVKETAESQILLGSRPYFNQSSMLTFNFIFSLHLMKNILGLTDNLSRSLQQRDQDIVNAVSLMKMSKERMWSMRESGWHAFLVEVSSFCLNNEIEVPQMEERYVGKRSRKKTEAMTNLEYYRDGLYYCCIDMQLEELNRCFDEVTTEILLCMSSLNPSNSFEAFDKEQLIRLAQFYPNDFSSTDIMVLHNQLELYIHDIRSNEEFSMMDGISDLVKKMVETKRDILYPLVFLLMTLSMIVPVATPTVDRTTSSMHTVSKILQSRIGDEWMNHCLVTYIEGDILSSIDPMVIMHRFEEMRSRGEL